MEIQNIISFKKILKNREGQMKKNPRLIVYLLVFLFTLHLTPGAYINSSFLEQFTGRNFVGYVYSVGSVITIFTFILSRRLLIRVGNYKTFMTIMSLNTLSLLVLSLSLVVNNNPKFGWIFVSAFIVGYVARSVAFLNIDIFLEHYTNNSDTGGVRGLFLTSLNFAFVLGPIIAGLLISATADSAKVYVWGFIVSLLVMFLARGYFKGFNDGNYEKSDMFKTLKIVLRDKNLFRIFSSNFILRFFFSWMVIYSPIFLHNQIGFTLSQIGLIIGIGLIPFIILEVPLGRVADSRFGEKEILSIGFIIAAISTFVFSLVSVKIFWVWALIIFITRVGASMIEVMSETYLFKKIDVDDVSIMELYRAVRPFVYVISPIIASVLLIFFDMKYLFVVLSFVIISGLFYSLNLQDTK
jgi:MFS family permease